MHNSSVSPYHSFKYEEESLTEMLKNITHNISISIYHAGGLLAFPIGQAFRNHSRVVLPYVYGVDTGCI